jgi:hypothetical protein
LADPHASAELLRRQRDFDTEADGKLEAAKRLILFVALTAQAVIGTLGISLIFWESSQEWGGLPSTAGNGIILYALAGVGVALLWVGAFYGWYRWRRVY